MTLCSHNIVYYALIGIMENVIGDYSASVASLITNNRIIDHCFYLHPNVWCNKINIRGITSLVTLMLTQIRGKSNHKCMYKVFSSVSKWAFWIPAIIFIIKILPHKIFTAQHFISHYNVPTWSVEKCHKKAAICFRL